MLYLCGGLAATGLYAAGIAPQAAFAVVGVGSVVTWFLAPWLHRTQLRRPWRLLTLAGVFFLLGVLIRPVVAGAHGYLVLLSDVFTLPGYLLAIAGLAHFLAARRGTERHTVIDGLIVFTGAAVASVVVFALPAASIPGRPVAVSVVAGVYPVLDAVLVLIVANLAFTTAVRQPSFILILLMMVWMFVGDVSYAIIGISGELYASPWLDLPFLLAFTLGGAAGLHPSARHLDRPTPLAVQEWSVPRLLLILPALACPFVLTIAVQDKGSTERWVLGAGGALMVALLLMRSLSAVQNYAAVQHRLVEMATHDPLTGLPNRRMVRTVVDDLLARPRPDGAPVWLFYLDLDGFKVVNDSWGHPAGDQLIKDVARRLRQALPEPATVARVGGDEFVVIRCCTETEALAQAQQILDCVDKPLLVNGAEVVLTASVGMACTGEDAHEDSTEALMRDADTAMYRTKSEGRGSFTVFDASMRMAVRERLDIEVALRSAVAQDQLVLEYQPIVRLATGAPSGAEALVRWRHPTRGVLGPTTFIPIAEGSNLISAIGTWVLLRSIEQLAQWRRAGVVDDDFWLSINVSPRQLTDRGLAGVLRAELERWDVPAACVVLEITESVMVDGGDVTEHVMEDLRALGVRIAVDDFGTGFSALGYLRRHPVTGVKIDRSFVAGLGANTEDEEIVRAVVAMSSALGLTVVAEGVETVDQRSVLDALGVTLAQGWLWGRATDPAAFAAGWAVPTQAAASGSSSSGNS
ncbi:hypothetical protein Val02_33700 [Virgisporangium aliadipatigenens]|uniref:Uncharacterized protein n=1 Tax=Virgisporangium aliadipatigenens TaxID=741659 RepID=A0A8J3YJD0_9ACTN|nr:hypothetical protein Val02_33700 [Virgisporangium aliadipatigenens]